MLQDAIDGVAESVTGGVGIGLIAVAAGAFLLAKGGKPTAKSAIKGWYAGRDKVKELSTSARGALAEAGERIQDLYAEAKAEARSDDARPGEGGNRLTEASVRGTRTPCPTSPTHRERRRAGGPALSSGDSLPSR